MSARGPVFDQEQRHVAGLLVRPHVAHRGYGGTPYVRTSCMVLGDRQLAMLAILTISECRKAHELAADTMLARIQEAYKDRNLRNAAEALLHAWEHGVEARPVLRRVR